MKCKKCGDEINLTVFGMPDDICWGCLKKSKKKVVLDKNIKKVKSSKKK